MFTSDTWQSAQWCNIPELDIAGILKETIHIFVSLQPVSCTCAILRRDDNVCKL